MNVLAQPVSTEHGLGTASVSWGRECSPGSQGAPSIRGKGMFLGNSGIVCAKIHLCCAG